MAKKPNPIIQKARDEGYNAGFNAGMKLGFEREVQCLNAFC